MIRDNNGEIVAAEVRRHEHVRDVLTMEAPAARDGLQLANSFPVFVWVACPWKMHNSFINKKEELHTRISLEIYTAFRM